MQQNKCNLLHLPLVWCANPWDIKTFHDFENWSFDPGIWGHVCTGSHVFCKTLSGSVNSIPLHHVKSIQLPVKIHFCCFTLIICSKSLSSCQANVQVRSKCWVGGFPQTWSRTQPAQLCLNQLLCIERLLCQTQLCHRHATSLLISLVSHTSGFLPQCPPVTQWQKMAKRWTDNFESTLVWGCSFLRVWIGDEAGSWMYPDFCSVSQGIWSLSPQMNGLLHWLWQLRLVWWKDTNFSIILKKKHTSMKTVNKPIEN